MPDRFDHLLIATKDFAASLAFYRDVLGWKVQSNAEGHATLSGGGVKVVLTSQDKSLAPGVGSTRMHLDIHDVDARFKLIAPGKHVVVAPQASPSGSRWFVLRDPDGNQIAFEESHRRG